jgi:hypothetical protein
MISGNNFQGGVKRGDGDYYFSSLPHIWGWASWRRVWRKYNFDVKDFPDFLKNKTIANVFDKKDVQKFWLEKIKEVYTHHLDTWDYQLGYAIWKNDGICISPNINLVSNIGFGAGATHTLAASDVVTNVSSKSMSLPLIHPGEVMVNKDADNLDNHTQMKHIRIKHFLKRVGLFNYVKNIYSKHL